MSGAAVANPDTYSAVTVIGPDGNAYQVPRANAQAAFNAGASPAIKMISPDGEPHAVPLKNIGDAIKAGGMTEGQYQQSQQSSTAAANPSVIGQGIDAVTRFLGSGAHAIAGGVKGIVHDIGAPPQPGAETVANMMPGGLQAYRAVAAPALDQAQQAIQTAGSPDLQTRLQSGAHALAALIPGLGPMAANVGDQMRPQLEQGNYAGAAGTLGGNALLALALKKGMETTGGAIASRQPISGENYTPQQGAAFEGLLAPATTMGKNFIPQNITPEVLSHIRQSVSDMTQGSPIEQRIAKVVTDKATPPLDRLGEVQSVIQRSLSNLEDQHAPVLQQYSNTPVDMKPIQTRLQSQIIPGMSQADIGGIQDLIDRAGDIKTIGQLNGFRQLLNDESSPSYRQTPTRAGQASAPQQVATDAANAVRAHYYDQLQQASGTDFQPLKQQESNLITTKEALENQQAPLAKQEAIFNAPSTMREKVGNVANVLKDPKTTVTQTLLRESPATRASNLIRQSLTNLPDPSPANSPITVTPPAQIGNIPNLRLTSGQPPTVRGVPVTTTPPMTPIPPALQAILNQARLSSGDNGGALPASASPNPVVTPSSAYPELNANTARTRIQPTQFSQPQVAASVGTRAVTPQGQVLSPISRYLDAGDIIKPVLNPSTNDLVRALQNMRKRNGK